MKFIVDRERSLNATEQGGVKDLLHTKRYADILLQSIKDAPQGEPYTIGLFGEWGSGKSSIITTMTEGVAKDEQLKKVKVINYDAWKYSGDSFRRMFLYELRNALVMGESALMQRFYANETHETKIKTAVNWKKVGLVFAFVVVSGITVWIINSCLGKGVAIPSTIALVALLFSLWSFVFDQLKVTMSKPMLFAPEQFEECYKEIVGCVTRWDKYKEKALKWITLGLHHEEYLRLVIVVDNIDRCQAETAYALLTDIKNFLCKEFDVIFVVPVDIEALRKHIVKSSDHQANEADEFLRKFFNASVWMKPYQNDEMYDFAVSIAKEKNLGFSADTISLVANEFATNPRRIIQLFNNLQIELLNYPTEFAEVHQTLICKMLIIREEFPKYYKQLIYDPRIFYVDIEKLKRTEEKDLSLEDKAILSDSRLQVFLHASTGISIRYSSREDVITKILVNTQIENAIPENIRQAYKTANAEQLATYCQEPEHLELLVNYLQDNIKKMASRGTYDSEGKTHISALLSLFEKNLLSDIDKKRLMSPLASEELLTKCAGLFQDKKALIRFGVDLEKLQMVGLSDAIVTGFEENVPSGLVYSKDDVSNIFYGASVWSVDRCKTMSDVFLKAFQENAVACRQYSYAEEKYDAIFSDKIFSYLLENLKVENCDDNDSAFQSFRYLGRIKAVNKENLLLFITKATEIAPAFDRNNAQKPEVLKYLKTLSDVFGEMDYLAGAVPVMTMTGLFDKMNAAAVTTNTNYGRATSTPHSLVTDKAGDEATAKNICEFFVNVNVISNGPVVGNVEIERFMKVEQNRDRVLDALMKLNGKGKDISTWANAIITDNRRTDSRRLHLLKEAFVKKSIEGEYEVPENVVKKEVAELIGVVQRNEENIDGVVNMLEGLLGDERIDKVVREILSGKTLEEQKRLPLSLMQRAIASFEQNIQNLSVQNDTNILQLIAANGSDEGIEGAWGLVNPILADGKNKPQGIINKALQVLMSFSRLTKEQAEALTGNVKAMPEGKISDENRKEVMAFLESFR